MDNAWVDYSWDDKVMPEAEQALQGLFDIVKDLADRENHPLGPLTEAQAVPLLEKLKALNAEIERLYAGSYEEEGEPS